MGIRGELYTTQVLLDNRAYFFNVKENRMGDIFLQIVESKNKNGEEFDRHAIVVFADDMQKFFGGLDDTIVYIDKAQKARAKARAERKASSKPSGENLFFGPRKKVFKKKRPDDDAVHIASKRRRQDDDDEF